MNSGAGIVTPVDAAISRCTATDNAGIGFVASSGSTFEACTASQNDFGGFLATDATVFRGCEARSNAGDGFQAGNGCAFESCTAHDNDAQYGFDAGVACTFTGCVASQNTGTQSISAGFECQGGCVFTSCMSYNNTSTNGSPGPGTGAGFIIGIGSTITGCNAATNRGDNIRAGNRCLIVGNKSNEAGFGGSGAAVRSTGDQGRIEGNHCSFSDIGIAVDGAGNFIVRNTSVENSTDYAIAANNYYGAIISRIGQATASVNGPSAAGTMGSTDPNANFSH